MVCRGFRECLRGAQGNGFPGGFDFYAVEGRRKNAEAFFSGFFIDPFRKTERDGPFYGKFDGSDDGRRVSDARRRFIVGAAARRDLPGAR